MSKNNHAKHNYSKYSNNNPKKPAELTEAIEETAVVVNEPAPAPKEPVAEQMRFIPVEGTVIDCVKLNVRTRPVPGANVLGTIEVNAKVEIDVEKSTADWFHVRTAAGAEGYCMRKYIKADL